MISGYVFYPVALILGVDIEDCYEVGGIIGTKIILMSFFSYWDMGILLKAGKISVSQKVVVLRYTHVCIKYILLSMCAYIMH